MRALLILFMTNVLLYPDKEANLMYGGYNALVYMMPLFGGMIADQIFGFPQVHHLGWDLDGDRTSRASAALRGYLFLRTWIFDHR